MVLLGVVVLIIIMALFQQCLSQNYQNTCKTKAQYHQSGAPRILLRLLLTAFYGIQFQIVFYVTVLLGVAVRWGVWEVYVWVSGASINEVQQIRISFHNYIYFFCSNLQNAVFITVRPTPLY